MDFEKVDAVKDVQIICPNCGAVEAAQEKHYEGAPFWDYVHDCTKCGYTIMESEWNVKE